MSIFLFGEVTQAWLAVSSVKHVSSTVLRGYALGFVLESQIEMAQFCAESNSGTDSCSTNQRATINETTSSRQNLWFAVSDSNLGTSTETLGPYATTGLWAARCQKSNWNVVECGLPTLDLPHPCFLRVSTKTCPRAKSRRSIVSWHQNKMLHVAKVILIGTHSFSSAPCICSSRAARCGKCWSSEGWTAPPACTANHRWSCILKS